MSGYRLAVADKFGFPARIIAAAVIRGRILLAEILRPSAYCSVTTTAALTGSTTATMDCSAFR